MGRLQRRLRRLGRDAGRNGDVFIGLRIGTEVEIEGLDVNLNGETVQ